MLHPAGPSPRPTATHTAHACRVRRVRTGARGRTVLGRPLGTTQRSARYRRVHVASRHAPPATVLADASTPSGRSVPERGVAPGSRGEVSGAPDLPIGLVRVSSGAIRTTWSTFRAALAAGGTAAERHRRSLCLVRKIVDVPERDGAAPDRLRHRDGTVPDGALS